MFNPLLFFIKDVNRKQLAWYAVYAMMMFVMWGSYLYSVERDTNMSLSVVIMCTILFTYISYVVLFPEKMQEINEKVKLKKAIRKREIMKINEAYKKVLSEIDEMVKPKKADKKPVAKKAKKSAPAVKKEKTTKVKKKKV
jgi:hypothetical protein